MKKTIVKAVVIIFVMSILMSAMFVMTGAECQQRYLSASFKDNIGNDCYIQVIYQYEDGEMKVSQVYLSLDYGKYGWLDGNIYEKKYFPLASSMSYKSSKKGYFNNNISLTTSERRQDQELEYWLPQACKLSLTIVTNGKREPKAGDDLKISFHDFEYPGTLYDIDTTVGSVGWY